MQAADREKEEYRAEMRKSMGAERQRVAGMLYKEALQKQTLEEQARQLDELNEQLADAREREREATEEAAAANEKLEQHAPQVTSRLSSLNDLSPSSICFMRSRSAARSSSSFISSASESAPTRCRR